MDNKQMIDETVDMTLKIYSAQPVVMDRGQGVYAYDTDGNKYLDFAAGIAVASLGHNHPKLTQVIQENCAKLMALQASYVTQSKHDAAKILLDNGPFDRVYFSNSGTESVETALKMARKWAYDTKGEDHHHIITFRNSFHGRSYGAASVTEKRLSQPFFDPYLPGVDFAEFNNLDSVKKLISDKTAAIIVEPVQGEGGLTPATPEFLAGLRALCDAHKVALIFDEIQCGSGRLGSFYAFQSFSQEDGSLVEPDIVCMAKGIGSGFPVGAVVAKKDFADSIVLGTHGTTYGGNPLACAVVACVMGEIEKDDFAAHTKAMGERLRSGLEALQTKSNKIVRITGKGLMMGFETEFKVGEVIGKLRDNGLMTTQAGSTLVRLTPPLIAQEQHIDEALEIIETTLKDDF